MPCIATSLVPYVFSVHKTILSRVQQTVMLVDTQRAYKRRRFSFWVDKNLQRRNYRTSVHTTDISRIFLVIRNQNKAEVGISGVEMFWIIFSFERQQITAES